MAYDTTQRNFYRYPYLSAKYVRNNDNENAIIGAITHIKKNFLTAVFLKMFLAPNFATPIPKIAATFNWTNEEGIPFVIEANSNKLADTKAIITASNFPNNTISFPVFFTILCPKIELPIPKLGATIRVDNIIIIIKFSSMDMLSSFAVIDAIGPAALATLFAPMVKATYNDINTNNPFQMGLRFSF